MLDPNTVLSALEFTTSRGVRLHFRQWVVWEQGQPSRTCCFVTVLIHELITYAAIVFSKRQLRAYIHRIIGQHEEVHLVPPEHVLQRKLQEYPLPQKEGYEPEIEEFTGDTAVQIVTALTILRTEPDVRQILEIHRERFRDWLKEGEPHIVVKYQDGQHEAALLFSEQDGATTVAIAYSMAGLQNALDRLDIMLEPESRQQLLLPATESEVDKPHGHQIVGPAAEILAQAFFYQELTSSPDSTS